MSSSTTYPEAPGYKVETPETSREAAEALGDRAATLRACAVELLRKKPMTSDEIAAELRTPFMSDADFAEFKRSIRPRVSELMADGLVEATAMRRKNISGKSAAVWTAIQKYGQLTLV